MRYVTPALLITTVLWSTLLPPLVARAQQRPPERPAATMPAAGGAPMRLMTVETLVGRWTGRWQASDGSPSGSLGVILSRVPGRETVVGQFTFVQGATARTLRYEGHLENGSVAFPLVAGGRIVLEAARDARSPLRAETLSGTWVEHRGALPVPQGTVELERAS
jgi:hypothetical protein